MVNGSPTLPTNPANGKFMSRHSPKALANGKSLAAAAPSLPDGYDEMTVAQVTAGVREWTHPEIEAALAFEQEHAARKGALSVLEAALAKEDG